MFPRFDLIITLYLRAHKGRATDKKGKQKHDTGKTGPVRKTKTKPHNPSLSRGTVETGY